MHKNSLFVNDIKFYFHLVTADELHTVLESIRSNNMGSDLLYCTEC